MSSFYLVAVWNRTTDFEVDHFSASGVELRKEWIYTSSQMYGLLV
jgi:hypothetical protein